MSQTRDGDRRTVDSFTIHPARYGAAVSSHRRADIEVRKAERRPVVTVTLGTEAWRFERGPKGTLAKIDGGEVPSWVAAALRGTGVGRV